MTFSATYSPEPPCAETIYRLAFHGLAICAPPHLHRITLSNDNVSYVLGKGGSTRKKLQTASNCVLQIVGCCIFAAGTQMLRQR